MSAITEASADLLDRTRAGLHPRCVVCGRSDPPGLGLAFRLGPGGEVVADFRPTAGYEGYGGVLHGGVISAIADGAMTNCLFAHGVAAVTAELNVRFRHPIAVGPPLTVRARIARRSEPLFVAEAELTQAGQVKATATGKFMQTPEGTRA